MSTICQSNDLSEPESIKLLNNKFKKNLTEDEINNVLESCGQDQQKMLNLCKDLLKNSSNPDLKAVISKHLRGKDQASASEERVTDSIKRKAKELNSINWKVDKFANNYQKHIQDSDRKLNIKVSCNDMIMKQNEIFDFSEFSIKKSDKTSERRIKDFRRMKFEKLGSVPAETQKTRADIFGSIDDIRSGEQCNPLDISNQTARFNDVV